MSRLGEARKRAIEIATELCRQRNTCLKDVFTGSKFREHMSVRHETFMILWKEGYSLARIGKAFGTEHTTVANGLGILMLKNGDTDHPFAQRVLHRREMWRERSRRQRQSKRERAA